MVGSPYVVEVAKKTLQKSIPEKHSAPRVSASSASILGMGQDTFWVALLTEKWSVVNWNMADGFLDTITRGDAHSWEIEGFTKPIRANHSHTVS